MPVVRRSVNTGISNQRSLRNTREPSKKYQTSKARIIRAGQKRRCAITGITTPGSALIAIHSTSLPPATYTATYSVTFTATYTATSTATYSAAFTGTYNATSVLHTMLHLLVHTVLHSLVQTQMCLLQTLLQSLWYTTVADC